MIFITGGTGYMGRQLIQDLLQHGHDVIALVRSGSENKIPTGARVVIGNALEGNTYLQHVPIGATFVHLVGVAHPSPSKAQQFWDVDYVSAMEAIIVAKQKKCSHFVYISVAQPAPVMKVYQAVRAQVELAIQNEKINASVLRPWYVIGPGHYWPLLLLPFYWLFERWPSTRESAKRLRYVSLSQMVRALVSAIETPAEGIRVWDVSQIILVGAPGPGAPR